jgi:hypothetical protein
MNVTVTVQLAATASVLLQVLVSAKSPASTMPLIVKGSTPELVKVTVWAGLVAFRGSAGKVKLFVDSVTAGEIPLPVRLIV